MGNEILSGDKFYISFNPLGPGSTGPETALCIRKEEDPDEPFAILNGDFTEEYEAAFPDLEQCKKVFRSLRGKHECKLWSTAPDNF